MSSSALPTILQSASRRADVSGLPGSLLLRPAKLLAPCADLTRSSSGHRDFYLQASDESVTLLAAARHHQRTVSRVLPPASGASLRPRTIRQARVQVNIGEKRTDRLPLPCPCFAHE